MYNFILCNMSLIKIKKSQLQNISVGKTFPSSCLVKLTLLSMIFAARSIWGSEENADFI